MATSDTITILQLIAAGESQSLEFKSEFPKQARDLAKEIAAFATSNSGVILLGVANNGDVVGLEPATTSIERDEFRKRIEGICNSIKPPLTPRVEFCDVRGRVVMVLQVDKGSAPIYFVQNVPYVRHLTSSRPAEPDEVSDLILRGSRAGTEATESTDSVRQRELIEADAVIGGLRSSLFSGMPGVLVSGPKLVVHIVPLISLRRPELRPADVKATRPLFSPSPSVRVVETTNTQQWVSHGPAVYIAGKLNPEATWSVRLVKPGYLEFVTNIGQRIDNDPDILVYGRDIEEELVSAVDRGANIAQRLHLTGPTVIAASLEEVEDVNIRRSRPGGRRIRERSIWLESVRVSALEAPTADLLRSIMDTVWSAGGWDDGSPFFAGDHWTGYDI